MLKIQVNNDVFPVVFGYGAFKRLGEAWGCSGIQQIFEKVSEFFNEGDDFTFEKQEILADLVLAGIQNAQPNKELSISVDDVAMSFFYHPNQIQKVVKAFMNALPKADPKPQGK